MNAFGLTGPSTAASPQLLPPSAETRTFLDASGARIGDAGNLVKARPLHGVAERGLGDEGFHLVDEVELVGLAVGQQRRVVARLVIGHGRLIDDLEPAQEFGVHVAFVAGQQQPHRIAVAGHDALAVLVERDDGVVVGLLQRHAAADCERIRALRQHPRRLRIDAGLVEQRRHRHAGPFRAGHQSVQRLQRRLDRLRREHRRAVAAAFDEMLARHHRVTHQRIDGEFQRLLDHAVDHQHVLVRVDVGNAGMVDGEMQRVRRDGAVELLQRRARVLRPRVALRIAERAHHVLFVFGRCLQHRRDCARIKAPLRLGQRLGGGAGKRGAGAQCAGKHHSALQ